MHFIKTVVSLFALSSFAAAHFAGEEQFDGLERREAAAHEDYLMARDEYIEKRDLFRRMGGVGVCVRKSGGRQQCQKNVNGKSAYCGKCRADAARGEGCLCDKDKPWHKNGKGDKIPVSLIH